MAKSKDQAAAVEPPAEASAVNVTAPALLPVTVVRAFGAHQLGDRMAEIALSNGVTLAEVVDALKHDFARTDC
jgi:hypothetical protein